MTSATLTLTACRAILGGLFIFSSIPKLLAPGSFYANVLEYQLFNDVLARAVAAVIPTLELMVAAALLSRVALAGGLVLSAMLLAMFTALHGWVVATGAAVSCGCFSVGGAAEAIGWMSMGRNALLLIVALVGCLALARENRRGVQPLSLQNAAAATELIETAAP